MEIVLDVVLEIIGALLETAADRAAKGHGRVKAGVCLALALVLVVGMLILGIHFLASGRGFAGIVVLAIDAGVIALFVAAGLRARG